MSDNFEATSPSGSNAQAGASTTTDAAKQEAHDLKDVTTTQAKDVIDTAKEEASSVVGAAKTQARDLFAQTQHELKEQAGAQQQRIAGGLRNVSDELGSMASNSSGTGVAGDLVQQASTRLSSAATWLGDRDPGAVLDEVKRYARRRPGTFILAAAVVGVAVGRLTRALATNASEAKGGASAAPAARTAPAPAPAPVEVHSDPSVPVPVGAAGAPGGAGAATPLYDRAASIQTPTHGEDGHDRPDTL